MIDSCLFCNITPFTVPVATCSWATLSCAPCSWYCHIYVDKGNTSTLYIHEYIVHGSCNIFGHVVWTYDIILKRSFIFICLSSIPFAPDDTACTQVAISAVCQWYEDRVNFYRHVTLCLHAIVRVLTHGSLLTPGTCSSICHSDLTACSQCRCMLIQVPHFCKSPCDAFDVFMRVSTCRMSSSVFQHTEGGRKPCCYTPIPFKLCSYHFDDIHMFMA
jgi:hypothetical protein